MFYVYSFVDCSNVHHYKMVLSSIEECTRFIDETCEKEVGCYVDGWDILFLQVGKPPVPVLTLYPSGDGAAHSSADYVWQSPVAA